MTQRSRHLVAGFAILLVIAGIVGGLMILGPPSEERLNRLDQKRVADLQEIDVAVNLYHTRREHLPADLEDVLGESGISVNWRDPETMQAYEYRPVDERKFELCAVFARESPRSEPIRGAFWSHGAGRRCFQPTITAPRPNE